MSLLYRVAVFIVKMSRFEHRDFPHWMLRESQTCRPADVLRDCVASSYAARRNHSEIQQLLTMTSQSAYASRMTDGCSAVLNSVILTEAPHPPPLSHVKVSADDLVSESNPVSSCRFKGGRSGIRFFLAVTLNSVLLIGQVGLLTLKKLC